MYLLINLLIYVFIYVFIDIFLTVNSILQADINFIYFQLKLSLAFSSIPVYKYE